MTRSRRFISLLVRIIVTNPYKKIKPKLNEKEYGIRTLKKGIGPVHNMATENIALGAENKLVESRLAIVKTKLKTMNNAIAGPAIAVTTNGDNLKIEPKVASHANANQW